MINSLQKVLNQDEELEGRALRSKNYSKTMVKNNALCNEKAVKDDEDDEYADFSFKRRSRKTEELYVPTEERKADDEHIDLIKSSRSSNIIEEKEEIKTKTPNSKFSKKLNSTENLENQDYDEYGSLQKDQYDDCYADNLKVKKEYEAEYFEQYSGDNLAEMERNRKQSYMDSEYEEELDVVDHQKIFKRSRYFTDNSNYLNGLRNSGTSNSSNSSDSTVKQARRLIKDEQYFLDNDHCLGREADNYKSNLLNENTEEEDQKELDELVREINKCYKEEDEDNISGYADILCRYFKANLKMSAKISSLDTFDSAHSLRKSLLCLHEINSGKYPKYGNFNDNNNIKRSLSFNSISEISLKKVLDIIMSKSKKIRKQGENSNELKIASTSETNPLSGKSQSSVTIQEILGNDVSDSDNIKDIIKENVEIDDTVKILLIGNCRLRSTFLQMIQYGDESSNKGSFDYGNDKQT